MNQCKDPRGCMSGALPGSDYCAGHMGTGGVLPTAADKRRLEAEKAFHLKAALAALQGRLATETELWNYASNVTKGIDARSPSEQVAEEAFLDADELVKQAKARGLL
jgi:hypothetical protein